MNELFLWSYVGINIVGFLIMGIDKNRAIKGNWRISEKTIWLIAIFGGAIGAFIGMNVFHHKTKHIHFKLGLPALSFIQIVACIWFF
ncbi:DUF1294 domain-containing protein [Bacillus kwashiorkori]|uniref:DUF1294 domain-containing protein n=1 Tax=Bacillus kwashiorkori TaxID=1522318 RepID=UPI0007857344|nr:DUF1294 domain-containing protein [Bacillus kwashiorkori]